MRLTHVLAEKIGPFSAPLKIDIDPKVTILTGANDAGKTSVLRAIRLLLNQGPAGEKDLNRDHLLGAEGSWKKDTAYTLEGVFELTQISEVLGLPGHEVKKPWSGTLRNLPAPDARTIRFEVSNGSQKWNSGMHTNVRFHVPTCVAIGFDENTEIIRPIIPLDKLNSLEKALLKIAFSADFNHDKFKDMSPELWEESISQAEGKINEQARRVLPRSDYFQFKFRSTDEARLKLIVTIRDEHQGTTAFDLRGNGAKKMVTILARLLVEGKGGLHRIVLIDEPENSLHADAQHLLREFLDDLCSNGDTQVIYSTHSPSMINPMRPQQVRLLKRTRIKGLPTSVVVPRPEELGFAAVRASWGLTAVDSLMYGPVTIIVEGPTEVHCIPAICAKLGAANIDGFADFERLLGLSHFLDGRGQNHVVVAKLAEAQGTRVVVYLDGDNHAAEREKHLKKDVPNTQAVLLPSGKEFEDLVPQGSYFEALVQELDLEGSPGELEVKYEAWLEANAPVSRYTFSKRVGRWLQAEFPEKGIDNLKWKPEIMQRAILIASVGEIAAESFVRLLAAIRMQLETTSFSQGK